MKLLTTFNLITYVDVDLNYFDKLVSDMNSPFMHVT